MHVYCWLFFLNLLKQMMLKHCIETGKPGVVHQMLFPASVTCDCWWTCLCRTGTISFTGSSSPVCVCGFVCLFICLIICLFMCVCVCVCACVDAQDGVPLQCQALPLLIPEASQEGEGNSQGEGQP